MYIKEFVLLLWFTAIVVNIRDAIVVVVDQAFALVILSQVNISTSNPSWNCGEHSDFILGRILLSFSLESSMINSDTLFDLMVESLLPFFWAKLFYIAHGLNFAFFLWIHLASEM